MKEALVRVRWKSSSFRSEWQAAKKAHEYTEQYRDLNPDELNYHYFRILQNIPQFVRYDQDVIDNMIAQDPTTQQPYENPDATMLEIAHQMQRIYITAQERRSNSEVLDVNMQRLRGLLIFSPGTNSLKNYILSNYPQRYIDGSPSGVAEWGTSTSWILDWTLDTKYTGRGGIFDKNRLPVLEQMGIRNQQAVVNFLQDKVRRPFSWNNPEKDAKALQAETILLNRWQNEYKQKYAGKQ